MPINCFTPALAPALLLRETHGPALFLDPKGLCGGVTVHFKFTFKLTLKLQCQWEAPHH